MSSEEIFLGLGLTVLLAVGCQLVSARFRVPAIVLLLPVGFGVGHFVPELDPTTTIGDAFSPLVTLAVAVILFEGGLELRLSELEGHTQRVVRRLLLLGIPLTWAAATLMAGPLLGLTSEGALMLGAILIVSGPTVVGPVLDIARPGRRVSLILGWEGTTIDPIGALIGALVFQAISNDVDLVPGREALTFLHSIGTGVVGGAVGAAVLWLLLSKIKLRGTLATEAVLATVVGVAALCDVYRDDTGLLAAILMGVALVNIPGFELPEDRHFFSTVVQLVIGVLFISISATVSVGAVREVLVPSLVLVVGLVILVRPLVAVVATVRTSLTRGEKAFIGWMDPRGIVAASTAATFSVPLAAAGIEEADRLLPATFLVIVGTVTLYGMTAAPVARFLRRAEPDEPDDDAIGLIDEPTRRPPPSDV